MGACMHACMRVCGGAFVHLYVCACVRACVRACVLACMRPCARARVHVLITSTGFVNIISAVNNNSKLFLLRYRAHIEALLVS